MKLHPLLFVLASLCHAQEPTTILEAAKTGDVARLKAILDADSDAWKTKGADDNFPLHLAALEGHKDAARLLIERGADIDAKGFFDWTPLHYAARGGHDQICRILLEAGANRDLKNGTKQTPLQVADGVMAKDVIANFVIIAPGAEEFIAAAADGKIDEVRRWLDENPKLIDVKGSDGAPAVIMAVQKNHIEVLQLLIERGADINQHSKDRTTALTDAAMGGHLDAVRLLLKHGAEVNPSLPDGGAVSTPLNAAATTVQVSPLFHAFYERSLMHYSPDGSPTEEALEQFGREFAAVDPAAFEGTLQEMVAKLYKPLPEPIREAKRAVFRLMLEAGADPKKDLAIFSAAVSGESEMVRLLLEGGADPNAEDSMLTTLGAALSTLAPISLIQQLLDAGADPLRDPNPHPSIGYSSLWWAVRFENEDAIDAMLDSLKPDDLTEVQHSMVFTDVLRSDPSHLQSVLDAGFNVNAKGALGWTPLNKAAQMATIEHLRLLLDAGADLEVKDSAGFTPLHTAADFGQAEHVKSLLKHGANVHAENPKRGTALVVACSPYGNAETLAALLGAGAKVDARDALGRTALSQAAILGKPEMVKQLLESGADPNVVDKAVDSPLRKAAEGMKISNFLVPSEGFQNPTASQLGSEEDYLTVARLLIDSGAEINVRAEAENFSALGAALIGGNRKMADLLLEHGADIELKNKMNRTPVWGAIASGKPELLEYMISLGAKVNDRDSDRGIPLHDAASRNKPEMVEILLKHGASINARTDSGVTPLFQAVFAKAPDAARMLLKHGADPDIAAGDGITPMGLAVQTNQNEIAKMLKKAK
ncbi:MAG: ankyrin repeat protein [Verrucomicrobiales bacterium]|jgi:ankyrin repeat protein